MIFSISELEERILGERFNGLVIQFNSIMRYLDEAKDGAAGMIGTMMEKADVILQEIERLDRLDRHGAKAKQIANKYIDQRVKTGLGETLLPYLELCADFETWCTIQKPAIEDRYALRALTKTRANLLERDVIWKKDGQTYYYVGASLNGPLQPNDVGRD